MAFVEGTKEYVPKEENAKYKKPEKYPGVYKEELTMMKEMNTMILDNKELEQVNGGETLCVGVGVDLNGGAICIFKGNYGDDRGSGAGLMACAYVGFGGGIII